MCATKNNQSIYFQNYPYLKRLIFLSQFGPSGGCRLPEVCMEIDPDARDWDREIEERIIQRTREYIQHHFPYLDHHEPTIVETCIYTVCVESKKLTQGSLCLALPSPLSWGLTLAVKNLLSHTSSPLLLSFSCLMKKLVLQLCLAHFLMMLVRETQIRGSRKEKYCDHPFPKYWDHTPLILKVRGGYVETP